MPSSTNLSAVCGNAYDVVIIGGGVQGACLFDRLAGNACRVLVCDRGDFSSGTSQASAMLLWGGLLYLKNADLLEVARLSAARDGWLSRHAAQAQAHYLSYVHGPRPHRGPRFMRASLWLYWALARCRRTPPRSHSSFSEQRFLSPESATHRIRFEEGRLLLSDSQTVMDWLRPSETAHAINYCPCIGGSFDVRNRRWHLDLWDDRTGRPIHVTTKYIVNAAGVWTDQVNELFGIKSPWQHLLAKGVSLCIPRPPGHLDTLVFDDSDEDEGCSLVPWGPVSLWGSTETLTHSPDDGRRIQPAEVERLVTQLNRRIRQPIEPDQITSLRCGVRGLVVPRGSIGADPIRLSRKWRVHMDVDHQWISIYGGKITSCFAIANHTGKLLELYLGMPPVETAARITSLAGPVTEKFPGLIESVPTASWCREHQMCRTLEDYLRRRTNIAQWVPRGGLGRFGEHRDHLLRIATELCGDPSAAVAAYQRKIERDHDAVLGISCEMATVND